MRENWSCLGKGNSDHPPIACHARKQVMQDELGAVAVGQSMQGLASHIEELDFV